MVATEEGSDPIADYYRNVWALVVPLVQGMRSPQNVHQDLCPRCGMYQSHLEGCQAVVKEDSRDFD